MLVPTSGIKHSLAMAAAMAMLMFSVAALAVDTDGDGVDDSTDNCPAVSNVGQGNIDADALGDACDPDIDGDGASNGTDAFPNDPNEMFDADGDGHGDNGDVFPTNPSEWADTDGDGAGDNFSDAFPLDPNEKFDSDGDGHGDNGDAFPLNANEWADTDGDGAGDNFSDAFPLDPNEQYDTDGDGHGDNGDVFPINADEWADADADSVGDNGDNCKFIANTIQLDSDFNGIGDVCDSDTNGTVKGDLLGSAVAVVDMNNDGFDDLIIGSPLADVTAGLLKLKDAGKIQVVSGANGSVLYTHNGSSAGQKFGAAIAMIADQDSDGIPDMVVGNPFADPLVLGVLAKDAGNVSLYSGATGLLLQTIADGEYAGDRFGAAVAVDENGNVIVGAPAFDPPGIVILRDAGRVYVYSGISNTVLYTRSGTQAGEYFGASVAANTVDHQLLVGSPRYDAYLPLFMTDAGRVQVFDATDNGVGAALDTKTGAKKGDYFGSAVTSLNEDFDGDTKIDWAVGIAGADELSNVTNTIMKDVGKVQIFSGLATAFTFEDTSVRAGDYHGTALCGSGDVNNDGDNDLVIGVPKFDAWTVVNGKTVLLRDAGRVEVIDTAGL